MAKQPRFEDVPVNSVVEVGIDGPEGLCLVAWNLIGSKVGAPDSGALACPGGQTSGPLQEADSNYGLITRLRFQAAGQAMLVIRVRRPDDSLHAGKTVYWPVEAGEGDRRGLLWYISTREGN